MRNLIRFHVTRHDRLVAEGGSPFQQRFGQGPGAREHSGTSLPRSAEYVSGQNFSASWVLSLIFFQSGIAGQLGLSAARGAAQLVALLATKLPASRPHWRVSVSIAPWSEINAPLP